MRRSRKGLPRSTGRRACRSCRAGRWSRRCRRAASCGSTAVTTRIAASRSRAWPPNGPRSRRRCRSISIFGMLTTKDAAGFLRPLARHARAARAVPFPEGHGAYTPAEACARGGRGRPRLRAHKRHRRGAGRPVGHPARADAYPDLWVALSRGRRSWPATVSGRPLLRAGRPQLTTVLIQLTSFCLGSAPILVAATWPFLNSSSVGIERTP